MTKTDIHWVCPGCLRLWRTTELDDRRICFDCDSESAMEGHVIALDVFLNGTTESALQAERDRILNTERLSESFRNDYRLRADFLLAKLQKRR